MNLKELEAIETINLNRSFSEAAEQLSYSLSAISKYVANVEKEIGLKLFNRSSKSHTLSLTSNGEALMPDISVITTRYRHMLALSEQLKGAEPGTLRIGSTKRFSSQREEELTAMFLLKNPNYLIEQQKLFPKDATRLLQEGKLDVMFALIQGDAESFDFFRELMENPDVKVIQLAQEREMFLAISDKHPLARQDEAAFSAFRDFSVVFHPAFKGIPHASAVEPFRRLAEKSGFDLKATYIGTQDTSAYRLATRMMLAVPVPSITFLYPGIKFVKVSDWESHATSYLFYMNSNRKKALVGFKKTLREYMLQEDSFPDWK